MLGLLAYLVWPKVWFHYFPRNFGTPCNECVVPKIWNSCCPFYGHEEKGNSRICAQFWGPIFGIVSLLLGYRQCELLESFWEAKTCCPTEFEAPVIDAAYLWTDGSRFAISCASWAVKSGAELSALIEPGGKKSSPLSAHLLHSSCFCSEQFWSRGLRS